MARRLREPGLRAYGAGLRTVRLPSGCEFAALDGGAWRTQVKAGRWRNATPSELERIEAVARELGDTGAA